MALEAEANTGLACSSCKTPNSAFYRCCECFDTPAVCTECIVTLHQLQPLHRIQRWTGTHFEGYSLCDLGLTMNLCRDRKPCPASFVKKEVIFVHTNGIHRCLIQFCNCDTAAPNFQQLLLRRLFPATLKDPATVFTFDLLRTFHQLTLSSKITQYDYIDALKKLTNIAFPQDVEVRVSFIIPHNVTYLTCLF